MRHWKHLVIGLLSTVSLLTAAPGRLETLAGRLSRSADSLADEGYRGFVDRDRGNRSDVEVLFLAQQFSACANLFQRLVREDRPASELRDAAAILRNQVRASANFGFGRRAWQEMAQTLDEIDRELNVDRWDGGGSSLPPGRVTGRMRWRGRVDDRIQIYIQGSSATPRTVSGSPVTNANASFTSPLPQRAVGLELRKLKGRGSVEIIQQPSRENGFTAVIEVFDSKGGSEDYEFEVAW